MRGIKFDDRILGILEITDRYDNVWLMRDKKCIQITVYFASFAQQGLETACSHCSKVKSEEQEY